MAAENVMDWLPGDVVIDLVTCPVSHGMKLRDFVPDVGTAISLRYDLPSHLCWGIIEIWAYEHRVLYMPGLFSFKSDVNARSLSQGRASRFSRRSIRLEQDIAATRRGSATTDHLAVFVPSACAIFVRTQLLVHIPPPTKFDPFAEAEDLDGGQGAAPAQRGKCVRGGSDSRDLDTAVVVGKQEHEPGASFSFILDHTGQTGQDIQEMHLMSPIECLLPTAHMCPLMTTMRYASCTKQRGSNWQWRGSQMSIASMVPPTGQGHGTQRSEHAGGEAGRKPVVIKEAEETSSDDSEETASNMS
ncbi:hypothetical protein JCGZ_21022 [Jatropha curcas]|uniref:Aminotransferase-like plant mobile domain-containing protein n=1 Tax=Jatropha curcas TaxID=180498 RepID=A0A067K532_JATCU|nr:hypothetical protein JCGZ_21022 [Jatropha curcas]